MKHTPINNTIISGDRGTEPPDWVKALFVVLVILISFGVATWYLVHYVPK